MSSQNFKKKKTRPCFIIASSSIRKFELFGGFLMGVPFPIPSLAVLALSFPLYANLALAMKLSHR
jgi:hypothetical protein